MTALNVLALGMISALAAAADTGASLPDPTRPYAFATTVRAQDLPAEGMQWRLNGIRIREGEKSAILNGQVVKAGDKLAGATVVEINPADVVLMQDTQKIVVKLIVSSIKKPVRNARPPVEATEQ
jgi:hypothetical protein